MNQMDQSAESGSFQKSDRENILEITQMMAERLGMEYQIVEQGSENEPVLQMLMEETGRVGADVLIEVCFPHSEQTNGEFAVAQLLATLSADWQESARGELAKASLYCSSRTLAGAFGIDGRRLYFRDNIILRPDYPLQVSEQLIIDGLANLMQSVKTVIDGMILIGSGAETMESAVEKELID